MRQKVYPLRGFGNMMYVSGFSLGSVSYGHLIRSITLNVAFIEISLIDIDIIEPSLLESVGQSNCY